jgi:hypothetical protein
MSKIALVSPASGTATFSITTPSGTSTDRTLTLPDSAGTIATESYVGTQALGVGQTWQNMTASRSVSVTYTNTTGKPISIFIEPAGGIASGTITIGAEQVSYSQQGATAYRVPMSFIVPNNTGYSVNFGFNKWLELR